MNRTLATWLTVGALIVSTPFAMAGTALAGDTAAKPAVSPADPDTIIDLGSGIKVNVCLYVSLEALLNDLTNGDDGTGGGILDIGDAVGLGLVDDLTKALGTKGFAQRKAKCTPPATTTTTVTPPTTIIVRPRPAVTRTTTVVRPGQTRVIPQGSVDAGGGSAPSLWDRVRAWVSGH